MCLRSKSGVLPEQPAISQNLKPALAGDETALAAFRQAWAERVAAVIETGPSLFEVVSAPLPQHQPHNQ